MKDKLPQSCKQCEYNHISIDCCWCDWNDKVSIETTYFQKKNNGIPDYCPLNILYVALKPNDMKDLIIAKRKELKEHLGKYDYCSQCNECKRISDELEVLEQEPIPESRQFDKLQDMINESLSAKERKEISEALQALDKFNINCPYKNKSDKYTSCSHINNSLNSGICSDENHCPVYKAKEHSEKPGDKAITDILECISKFDDTESLENKGRYFDVIQKDVRNLNPKP